MVADINVTLNYTTAYERHDTMRQFTCRNILVLEHM